MFTCLKCSGFLSVGIWLFLWVMNSRLWESFYWWFLMVLVFSKIIGWMCTFGRLWYCFLDYEFGFDFGVEDTFIKFVLGIEMGVQSFFCRMRDTRIWCSCDRGHFGRYSRKKQNQMGFTGQCWFDNSSMWLVWFWRLGCWLWVSNLLTYFMYKESDWYFLYLFVCKIQSVGFIYLFEFKLRTCQGLKSCVFMVTA